MRLVTKPLLHSKPSVQRQNFEYTQRKQPHIGIFIYLGLGTSPPDSGTDLAVVSCVNNKQTVKHLHSLSWKAQKGKERFLEGLRRTPQTLTTASKRGRALKAQPPRVSAVTAIHLRPCALTSHATCAWVRLFRFTCYLIPPKVNFGGGASKSRNNEEDCVGSGWELVFQ